MTLKHLSPANRGGATHASSVRRLRGLAEREDGQMGKPVRVGDDVLIGLQACRSRDARLVRVYRIRRSRLDAAIVPRGQRDDDHGHNDRNDDEGRCRRETHVAVDLTAGDHRVEITGRGSEEHHDDHGEDHWTPRIGVSIRVEGECAGEDEVDPRQVKRELRKLFKRMERLACMVRTLLPADLAVPDEDELGDDEDFDDPVADTGGRAGGAAASYGGGESGGDGGTR